MERQQATVASGSDKEREKIMKTTPETKLEKNAMANLKKVFQAAQKEKPLAVKSVNAFLKMEVGCFNMDTDSNYPETGWNGLKSWVEHLAMDSEYEYTKNMYFKNKDSKAERIEMLFHNLGLI